MHYHIFSSLKSASTHEYGWKLFMIANTTGDAAALSYVCLPYVVPQHNTGTFLKESSLCNLFITTPLSLQF